MAKHTVTLPHSRETSETVVYALKDITSAAVGQLYVRKKYLPQDDEGNFPRSITITVEAGE